MNAGTAVLTNCTLSENDGSGAGGALSVGGGTTTLTGCTVQKNTSNGNQGWGGGAYVAGTLILDDTDLLENEATVEGLGGGVFVDNGGTLEIKNGSSISGNTATNAGGVWMQGNQVTLTGNSSISDNTAAGEAGGVAVISGTFTMESGEISGNTAETGMAGGVENGGTFEMKDGTITGNEATSKTEGIGGGVANITGTFTMSGTAKLYGNTAGYGGDDFYNNGEPPKEGGGGLDIDDGWEGNPDMGLESLSATTRAGDDHGTFTLLDPSTFNIEGATEWFEDPPGQRYKDHKDNDSHVYFTKETHEYYLTLGVDPPEEEADLTLWYYQVYLDEGDGTWLLWKHGQGGWAELTDTVEIKASDFENQSLGWGGTLGSVYTHDSGNSSERLSDEAQKATKTNPLKIYFKKS